MKILGKEPAFWVGVAQAVIAVLVSFGLDDGLAVVVNTLAAAAAGVLVAWTVKDTLLAALLAFAQAVAGLVIYLGYDLTDAQVATILGVLSFVLGGWLRTQTSSTDTSISAASDGLLTDALTTTVEGDVALAVAPPTGDPSAQFPGYPLH